MGKSRYKNENDYSWKKIGARIKNERNRASLTQKELLLKIGRSDNSHQEVSKWETGKKTPHLSEMLAMCEVFGCELGYLLCEYDAPKRVVADVCEKTGLSPRAVGILIRKNDIVNGSGNKVDKELWYEDAEDLEVLNFIIENHIVETENPLFTDPDRENLFELLYNYLLSDGWFKDGGQEVREISVVRVSDYVKTTRLFGLNSNDLNEIDWQKLANAFSKLRVKVIKQREASNGKHPKN